MDFRHSITLQFPNSSLFRRFLKVCLKSELTKSRTSDTYCIFFSQSLWYVTNRRRRGEDLLPRGHRKCRHQRGLAEVLNQVRILALGPTDKICLKSLLAAQSVSEIRVSMDPFALFLNLQLHSLFWETPKANLFASHLVVKNKLSEKRLTNLRLSPMRLSLLLVVVRASCCWMEKTIFWQKPNTVDVRNRNVRFRKLNKI